MNENNWVETLEQAESAEELRKQFRNLYPAFTENSLNEAIILGAAGEGVRLAQTFADNSIKTVAICDDNPDMVGQKIGDCVVSRSSLLEELPKKTPVIVASHRLTGAFQKLTELGFENVAAFAVLQILNPEIYQPHMFYENWLEDLWEGRAEVSGLLDLFKDERSHQVLNSVLAFRLTLDPQELDEIIEWDLYASGSLLSLSDNEIYVDGGTFDGDTIRAFIDRVEGKYERVYGFEPDSETFEKLRANFEDENRVVPINKGLFSREDTFKFNSDASRGSIFSEEGDISVPVTSLDTVLEGNRASYIKMNIEGFEIPALHGAQETIKKWAPKLVISAYHRPTDLWEIAKCIRELNPNYDLYLRQHDGGVIETVVYAIPR